MEKIKNGPKRLLVLVMIISNVNLSHQSSGMDFLEPYMRSGLGIALKASNGKYWTVGKDEAGYWTVGKDEANSLKWVMGNPNVCEMVPLFCYGIFAAKAHKDSNTKFDIIKVDSNTIRLKNSANGKYLTRWHSGKQTYIQARKSSPDIHCNFLVYEVDGKLVLKSVSNGNFLARVEDHSTQFILADRGHIDSHTKFLVETASILPITEEIIDVTWGSTNDFANMRPTAKNIKTVTNHGSEPAEMELTVSWSLTETSETSWEHGWGVTAGMKFTQNFSPVPGTGPSLEVSLEVNYNGKKAGNEGQSKTKTISETTRITVPPRKKVIATLMVMMVENADIPFTATIQRTSTDLGVQQFTERGTWRGVVQFDSNVLIREYDVLSSL